MKYVLKIILINLVKRTKKKVLFYLKLFRLDLVVDASIDEGVNGCCIRSITTTSTDICLKSDDFILSMNNENMRKISNAQARSIIRRASLIGSDIR